jgi:protein TonB
MPTLGQTQGRRIPLAPRRRVILVRRRLGRAAGVSVALHAALLAAMIITFPNRTPQEAAAPPSVEVVFQPGAKTAATPVAKKGPAQKAQEAAPRGPEATARVAQAARPAPPPAPPPLPPPPLPPPPKPVVRPPPVRRSPKPVPSKPVTPKPVTPKPVTPKPPAPPLPKINLPPPPPAAPPLPTPPVPVPTPAPPAPPVDDSQAEMNLDLPPMPELAPTPLPQPPPLRAQQPRLTRRSSPSRSSALGGGVVMNGLSFSGGSSSQGHGRARSTLLPQAPQIGQDSDFSSTNDIGTDWYAELKQWAEARVVYPEFAADLGQTGDVTVRFTVDRFGHVTNLRIVSASPYALLNEGWLSLWRGATVPSFPPGTKDDSTVITYTVVFEQ